MKKAGDILNTLKKYVLTAFILMSVIMNAWNYIRGDYVLEPGKLYEWQLCSEENTTKNEQESRLPRKPKGEGDSEVKIIGSETAESKSEEEGLRVNINSAGSEELQKLNGIGPAKAEAIIEYREKYGGFVCIEEIMEVKGIGEGIFAKIREYISVD